MYPKQSPAERLGFLFSWQQLAANVGILYISI
jgi:hypothetical protein